MLNIKIKIFKDIHFLSRYRDSWNELLPDQRWKIFLHPNWYRCFCETYYRNAQIRILAAFIDEKLVGILPVAKQRMNKFGLFLPLTEVISGRRSDYWCPIIKEGMEERVFSAFIESVFGNDEFSGTFIWPHLPEVSKYYGILKAALEKRGLSFVEQKTICPWMRLKESYDAMEKTWKRNHRTDLRRRRRRIVEDYGKLSLYVVRSKEEARILLKDFFEMHNKQWLSRGLPATFTSRINRELFYKFIDYLWEDGVHFSAVKCKERIIAYHFGFLCNGFLLWYKPTFDVALQNYSPSKIHISLLIERGIKMGWQGIDFLQGVESYKYMWSDGEVGTSSFIVETKKNSLTYAWLTKGRPSAEKNIGALYNRIQVFLQNMRGGR